MFRVFHVLVTVLGMILCPFPAQATWAERTRRAGMRKCGKAPTCSCCQHCAGPTDRKQSRNGQEDRESPSGCDGICLCKGALKGDQGASFDTAADAPNMLFALPADLNDTCCMEASESCLSGGPPTSYPVGRAARLAYQSLLC